MIPIESQAATPPSQTRFLDIHVLHSVPFSNLNRDDLGQPKEAHYGGVRRVRVSSQCIKRTVRKRMEADQVCEAAVRTKRLPREAARLLAQHGGWTEQTARIAAVALCSTIGNKKNFAPDKKKENLTRTIAFVPPDAANKLAAAAISATQLLQAAISAADGDPETENGRREIASELSNAIKNPKGSGKVRQAINSVPGGASECGTLVENVEAALRAVNPMIALMGRMYADLPAANVDGAVQVAHAITTHAAVNDSDYFSTVDDLSPVDETGAGFLDVADYASGVFYKYATVDLEALRKNMDASPSEQATLAAAFADRFARWISDAKKRVTAPHTPPSLVLIAARPDSPLSYANAFERPVAAAAEGGYLACSIRRLLDEDAEASGEAAPATRWLYMSRTAIDDGIDQVGSDLTRLPLHNLADAVTAHLTEARTL